MQTTQDTFMALAVRWMTDVDRARLHAEDGPDFDAGPVFARALLESPARGRELVATCVQAGLTPLDLSELMVGVFAWIDEHLPNPDESISLVCERCDLEWSRISGGYRVRDRPALKIGYVSMRSLPFADLFDGRLQTMGIREDTTHELVTEQMRCLVDRNTNRFLWVARHDSGLVGQFAQYGLWNDCQPILAAISRRFGLPIVSEYQPAFWGYGSRDAWWAAMTIMEEAKVQFIKAVAGEPCEFDDGSEEMRCAQGFRATLLREFGDLNRDRIEAEVGAFVFSRLPRMRESYQVYAFGETADGPSRPM